MRYTIYVYNPTGKPDGPPSLALAKADILRHCEDVRRENPTAWRNAHNGAFDRESRRFNDLCVQRLRAHGYTVGLNGKRGDPNSKSDDVLNFPLMAGQGGAPDRSGRFAEIAVIDFIGAAGSTDPDHPPYIVWIDQSKAAPGYFLDPEGLARDGGMADPPVITPPPVVTPPPAPSIDLAPLHAKLDALTTALADIASKQQAVIDGLFSETQGSPSMLEHIDDVKHMIGGGRGPKFGGVPR